MAGGDPASAVGKDKKDKPIYVSTVSLLFMAKSDAAHAADFTLYRVASLEERDRLLQKLSDQVEKGGRNETQINFLSRSLTLRNYGKEYVYILLSPATKGIIVEKPYHMPDQEELIFDVTTKKSPHPKEIIYMRVYTTSKSRDVYKIMLNQAGKKNELEWQSP